MIGIVESRADEASEHVCEQLRREGSFGEHTDADRPDAEGGGTFWRTDAFELRSFDDLHLELDNAAAAFDDPDLLVFASRHSGDTGPLLSAHPTGNFGEAEYGGEDRSLARAPPNALASVLDALAEHAPEGYDVAMECTHHGPTEVEVPSMFVELGSGPAEWDDPAGAAAVARAILDLAGVAADEVPEGGGSGERRRHVVGFGGGHYAPRFTRIARETDWAVGHVAADWSLEELGNPEVHSDVVDRMFTQSAAEFAVVEGRKPTLAGVIEDLGYRVVSETWVRETSGVPLWLVAEAEGLVCSVEDGLRFGGPARELNGGEVDAEIGRIELPAELLDTAAGIDGDVTIAALEETCVAFETEEGGTRPGECAVVSGGELPQALVGKVAAILRERFDSLSVESDRIVAEETAFEPQLAVEAGVPEGPKFGRLSGGESVEVDGETIEPEDVHERRRVEFEIS